MKQDEQKDLWRLVGWLVALFILAIGILTACIYYGIRALD